MFSSRSFVFSGFTFRSLIHFEVFFFSVYGVRKCSDFIPFHVTEQFSQHHLLKRLLFFFFAILYSCLFVHRLIDHKYVDIFLGSLFFSRDLWSVCLFLYQYLNVLITVVVQLLSCVWLFAIPWIVPCLAPLSMGFSRQEYWGGLPFPSPGIFPDQGWNPHLHC